MYKKYKIKNIYFLKALYSLLLLYYKGYSSEIAK